jgi:hypothetical protein
VLKIPQASLTSFFISYFLFLTFKFNFSTSIKLNKKEKREKEKGKQEQNGITNRDIPAPHLTRPVLHQQHHTWQRRERRLLLA